MTATKTVFIKTYGCQMNERDSEAVAAQLLARGYQLSPSEHGADVVLLNTETSEANNTVIIGVGEQKAKWQCLVKNGKVAEVMSLTNEGAN